MIMYTSISGGILSFLSIQAQFSIVLKFITYSIPGLYVNYATHVITAFMYTLMQVIHIRDAIFDIFTFLFSHPPLSSFFDIFDFLYFIYIYMVFTEL